ncbi:6-phosphofructo-2-kinase/fructose-2,6-bisphosphatase-like [Iris pallida]|uniref:6-phosphofructo-2-kinase/fructose-2, 6-bisphosphatase-like n=1 Tax=Iris pallida TaxID=29817 RepID=A0AAX6ET74_IRIPA|nr:6-phosphofructo-2-kinase/fructose-2,6-bisphosphatase-like [Iris pallida]
MISVTAETIGSLDVSEQQLGKKAMPAAAGAVAAAAVADQMLGPKEDSRLAIVLVLLVVVVQISIIQLENNLGSSFKELFMRQRTELYYMMFDLL